jgi:FKBP-type peptidyl-prolyl cis-trans isomerase FklB
MKYFNNFLIVSLFIIVAIGCKPTKMIEVVDNQPKMVQMANQADSVSYALGVLLQSNLSKQGFDSLDYEVMARAMQEADTGAAQMQLPEANVVVQTFQEELNKKRMAEATKEGAAFLAANATKEGVKTTASGLQYKVLTPANGAKPADATAKVNVHYEGRLLDGTIFDSSYKRGEPISFGLNQVIPGWTEGVQLMETGSKYEFYIPYNLAYGERGSGASIPPYATLIFVVELLGIE